MNYQRLFKHGDRVIAMVDKGQGLGLHELTSNEIASIDFTKTPYSRMDLQNGKPVWGVVNYGFPSNVVEWSDADHNDAFVRTSVTSLFKLPTWKPPYFVVDGPEGVGKTTYMPKLKAFLESKGHEVVAVREPGQTAAGALLRTYILDKNRGVEQNIELFLADRILTQQLVVIPALRAGKVVISDRSLLCTAIYQGLMEDPTGRLMQKILDIHAGFRDFLYPTLGIIAELPVETAMQRIAARSGDTNNWLDNMPRERHELLRKCFDEAHLWSPFPIARADFNFGEDEAEKIHEQIYNKIEHLLPRTA